MAKKSSEKSRPRRRRRSGDPTNEPRSPEPSSLTVTASRPPRSYPRGTGPGAAGQSGAIQGLPRDSVVDAESVEELLEEGQAHEAEFVNGVENAPGPEQGEVRTHEPHRRHSRNDD